MTEIKETILFLPIKNKIIKLSRTGNVVNISYGRVGQRMLTKTIPVNQYKEFYDEKIRLGYVDQTGSYEQTDELGDEPVKKNILMMLKEVSRQIVRETYALSKFKPTQDTMKEAEGLLLELASTQELGKFNEILLNLFGLIPRKMSNVIANTARSKDDFKEIVERESDMLKNLSVYQEVETDDPEIIFAECSEQESEWVKSKLDADTKRLFSNAWKVENKKQNAVFAKYLADKQISVTKHLFHGSRTENWWSIIKGGLQTNPVNVVITGKMFGNGIYFAPKAHKSYGYTSLAGARWSGGTQRKAYMAMYEVAYGDAYHVNDWSAELSFLDERKFKKYKKDCLHAHAGRSLLNDEVIIYNNQACRIKYLIELKR